MKGILESHGIVKRGHFKLTSGRHSSLYINKDIIFCNPSLYRTVCIEMWLATKAHRSLIDIVTGPAIAGAIFARSIASLLGDKIFVYPEKHRRPNLNIVNWDALNLRHYHPETMTFRQGYGEVIKGRKVWIVEDIITTGGSVDQTIEAVKDCGGDVLGVSAIWNRGGYKPKGGVFLPLIDQIVMSYLPGDCPQCAGNIPLQNPKE